jgi:hypothetical protein
MLEPFVWNSIPSIVAAVANNRVVLGGTKISAADIRDQNGIRSKQVLLPGQN